MWGALQVARDKPLYTDFTEIKPAVPLTYGPLAYWVPGTLAQMLDITEARQVTRVMRLISAGAFVSLLFLLVMLARVFSPQKKVWVVALLPLFWFPYICEWSGKAFPDFPALFLSVLGWYFARKSCRHIRLSHALAAVLLWGMAFYFKPIVTVGLSAFIGEWIGRTVKEKRVALRPAFYMPLLAFGVLAGIVSILINWHTNGMYRLHTIDSAMHLNWSLANYRTFVLPTRESWLIPVLIALALINIRRSTLALPFLIEVGIQSVLLIKEGASINYWSGSVVLFGLMLAQVLGQIRFEELSQRIWFKASAGCIALILALNIGNTFVFLREIPPVPAREVYQAAQWIPHENENRLCVSPYFALVYDLPCPFMDTYHAAILERAKVVSFRDEASRIASGNYQVIIGDYLMYAKPEQLKTGALMPLSIVEANRENMKIEYQGNFLTVMSPR